MPAEPRAVDALAAELFAPILDRTACPPGWRPVSWDAEQGLALTLARGSDAFVLIELEARDAERGCHARTTRFNVCARRVFAADPALEPDDHRAVDAVLAVVREREGALPHLDRPTTSRRVAVREIEVARVLIAEGPGHYYVNPYVGCMIGCEFCYVAGRADLSRSLEGLPAMPWGRWVDVKVNAPEVLREEVRGVPPGVVRFSPILTDPYQPVEKHYRVTRRCLEVLLDASFVPVVLTRSALVRDDIELLARFPRAAVGLSVPTDDDHVRAQFEPGADPIEERIDALASCRAAGIRTFAVVQPVLPMNPRRLVSLLSPHVRAVRIDRMHEMSRARPLYEAAGAVDASTDAFFDRTVRELRDGFAAAGVAMDALDDLGGLVASRRAAIAPRADVKVGFACNNRCVFCAQGEKRTDCVRIPFDELVTRLQQVRRETRGLVLTGGEPTVHREILRVVAAARAIGFGPIQIQTNGRMLSYEGTVAKLVAAGATEFAPSLHGSVASIHDALTRAPGSYLQTVAGITNVLRVGANVVTNSVITRGNLTDLPALVRLLGSLGVRQAQLAFVHPVGTAMERFEEVVPRLSDVVTPLRDARKVARGMGMRLVTEAVPYCFLPGMEELAVEGDIPQTTVVDLDGQSADYSAWRQVEGKAHGPPCEGCASRAQCEGPWREYVDAFGWSEFVPVGRA